MGLTAGEIVYEDDINTLRASSDLKPVCRAVANAVQSIPHNTNTALLFGGEDIDTHGFHSVSVNTGRITPTIAGTYRFTATGFIAGFTDYTNVNVWVRLNGVTNLAPASRRGNFANAQAHSLHTSVIQIMNGTTDYVEAIMLHANAAVAARNTNQSSTFTSVFEAEYIRGL